MILGGQEAAATNMTPFHIFMRQPHRKKMQPTIGVDQQLFIYLVVSSNGGSPIFI
jgi:hypothetical protein